MDSPLGSAFANLLLRYLEKTSSDFVYVIERQIISNLLNYFNLRCQNTKFIVIEETNNSLHFLNIKILWD